MTTIDLEDIDIANIRSGLIQYTQRIEKSIKHVCLDETIADDLATKNLKAMNTVLISVKETYDKVKL